MKLSQPPFYHFFPEPVVRRKDTFLAFNLEEFNTSLVDMFNAVASPPHSAMDEDWGVNGPTKSFNSK